MAESLGIHFQGAFSYTRGIFFNNRFVGLGVESGDAKRLQLASLPVEVIAHILYFLNISDLIQCREVSVIIIHNTAAANDIVSCRAFSELSLTPPPVCSIR
jgi:hypothetical protein